MAQDSHQPDDPRPESGHAALSEPGLGSLGDDDLAVCAVLTEVAAPPAPIVDVDELRDELARRFGAAIADHARAAGARVSDDASRTAIVERVLHVVGPSRDRRGLIREFDPRRERLGLALAGWVRRIVRDDIRAALSRAVDAAGAAEPAEDAAKDDASQPGEASPTPQLHPPAPAPEPIVTETAVPEPWGDDGKKGPWSDLPNDGKEVRAGLERDLGVMDEPGRFPGVSPEVASFRLFADAGILWRFGGNLMSYRDRLSESMARLWTLQFLEALDLVSEVEDARVGGRDAVVSLLLRRDRVQSAVSLLAALVDGRTDRGLARRLCRVISELDALDSRLLARMSDELDASLPILAELRERFDVSLLRPNVEWWWFGRPGADDA